ncbi:hypothetical protein D1872_234770 [compost metagenome]
MVPIDIVDIQRFVGKVLGKLRPSGLILYFIATKLLNGAMDVVTEFFLCARPARYADYREILRQFSFAI